MLTIAFFISFIEFFSSRMPVWCLFMISICLLHFSFCSCFHCFPDFSWLSFCVFSFESSKHLFWIVDQVDSRVLCLLSLVMGGLLCSFGEVMCPWFFVFLGVLRRCLHIRSSSHLLWSLPVGFRWEVLFTGASSIWDFLQPCTDTSACNFLIPLVAGS